jgi:1-aminocyclopropane-1-carboxylate deaminase/D-cysteine desulfhydrase-like pyridoxal-dependent ACC family enzyme
MLTTDTRVMPKRFQRLSEELGIDLWVQEDYLLPYPFAGNKWVKVVGEYKSGHAGNAYVTNGGLNSNHCRTLAMWSAFHGHRCHLVLHNDSGEEDPNALAFLDMLGATHSVVRSAEIADTISVSERELRTQGFNPVVVPGGGHSPRAIRAYANYAAHVLANTSFDAIFHASGTGGTQAGLCIANHETQSEARVIGVSVARSAERGRQVVLDAIRETSGLELNVDFRSDYIDGGYGMGGAATREAVAVAGAGGLVLDLTYTGKAFAGLLDAIRTGSVASGSKVLFWHTGGLYLTASAASGHGVGER